jgi:hypothetical protein
MRIRYEIDPRARPHVRPDEVRARLLAQSRQLIVATFARSEVEHQRLAPGLARDRGVKDPLTRKSPVTVVWQRRPNHINDPPQPDMSAEFGPQSGVLGPRAVVLQRPRSGWRQQIRDPSFDRIRRLA